MSALLYATEKEHTDIVSLLLSTEYINVNLQAKVR